MTARRDLVIRPRWDLASGLGAAFIAYALIGYPLVGVLGGHALRVVPVSGSRRVRRVQSLSG